MRSVGIVAATAALGFPMAAAAMPSLEQMKLPCDNFSGYEQKLPPILTYWEDGKEAPGRVEDVGGNSVRLRISIGATLRALRVDYTPFLHAWTAVSSTRIGKGDEVVTVPIPILPSNLYNEKAYSRLVLKVFGNGKIAPGAVVMFSSGYYDGGPYSMKADQNGIIQINCFQSVVGPWTVELGGNEYSGTDVKFIAEKSVDYDLYGHLDVAVDTNMNGGSSDDDSKQAPRTANRIGR